MWVYASRGFDLTTTLITVGLCTLLAMPLAAALIAVLGRRVPLPPAWVFVTVWMLGTCLVIAVSHAVVFSALEGTLQARGALPFIETTIRASYGGVLLAGALLGLATHALLARRTPDGERGHGVESNPPTGRGQA